MCCPDFTELRDIDLEARVPFELSDVVLETISGGPFFQEMTQGRLTEPADNAGCCFQNQSSQEGPGNMGPWLVMMDLNKVTPPRKQLGKEKESLPRDLKFVHGGNLHEENLILFGGNGPQRSHVPIPLSCFVKRCSLTGSNSQDRQIRPTRGHPASMQLFPAILTCLQTSTRCKVELELCQPSRPTPLLSSPDWHLHSAHPFVAIIREIKPYQTPIQELLPP